MKNQTSATAFTCCELWSVKLPDNFTTLAIATLFSYDVIHMPQLSSLSSALSRSKGQSIVLGCEDGMVRLHDVSIKPPDSVPQTVLETKSGPIQCVAVHDVTRFYHNDLIVGDSFGMLTIFCNQQILSRQSISNNSIICMAMIEEEDGGSVIVTSNDSGVITGVSSTAELWRIDLNSLSNKNPSLPVKIGCLTTVHLSDSNGSKRRYILAADNARRIHVICQGSVVTSLHTPANITAMTQGRFVSANQLTLPSMVAPAADSQQVALGANNGSVYIMHQFHVTLDEFVNTKAPITTLGTLPQTDNNTDLLLCAGHFSSLLVFKDGLQMTEFPTSDWVSNIVTTDLDEDSVLEIVVGCLDGTLTALKL